MNDETQPIETAIETHEEQTQEPAIAPVPAAPDLRILRKESCPSVSGRSTLTYHIGVDRSQAVQLRIFANTGNGMWSKDWISMALILELVAQASEENPLTSSCLQKLFLGKSINTAGFLLAVLKNEGLINTVIGSLRNYQCNETSTFSADIRALMESGVSLDALPSVKPVKPAKPTKKPSRKAKKG